jgi:hypothetical protein
VRARSGQARAHVSPYLLPNAAHTPLLRSLRARAVLLLYHFFLFCCFSLMLPRLRDAFSPRGGCAGGERTCACAQLRLDCVARCPPFMCLCVRTSKCVRVYVRREPAGRAESPQNTPHLLLLRRTNESRATNAAAALLCVSKRAGGTSGSSKDQRPYVLLSAHARRSEARRTKEGDEEMRVKRKKETKKKSHTRTINDREAERRKGKKTKQTYEKKRRSRVVSVCLSLAMC